MRAPRWAISAALAVAFLPLTWYVSAWRDQFESIYVLLELAGLGELAVFLAVLRRPTRDGLLLGLPASVLVAFCFLATMHERNSYGAVIFLAAATSGRLRAAAWALLALAATANVIATIPPSTVPGSLIPLGAPVAVGSLAILGVAAGVILLVRLLPGHRSS